jgi:hypothetical protein
MESASTYPGDQALLPFGHGVIHGLPPGQELQEHDTEAVDVALLRQLARHRVPEEHHISILGSWWSGAARRSRGTGW